MSNSKKKTIIYLTMIKTRIRTDFLLGVILIIGSACYGQDVNNLKLKNFRPGSIYKNPQTEIGKAKYPVIDMHSHDNPATDIDKLIKLMDETGIEKQIILSYSTGARFD